MPLGEEMEASSAINARRSFPGSALAPQIVQIDRSHRVLECGCFEHATVDHRLALGVVSHGETKSLANLRRIRNLSACARKGRSSRIR